jgi:hypothetical protein
VEKISSATGRRRKPINVTYTGHAKLRIRQRRISRLDVYLAIVHPSSSTRLTDEDDKWMLKRQIGRRILIVIAYRRQNNFKVKTAYFSRLP